MKNKLLVMGIVLALTVFLAAGCVGGAPGNQTGEEGAIEEEQGVEEETGTQEETGGETEGETTGAGWCEPGTEWSYAGSAGTGTGESSMKIEGKVQYDGQEMCKAVYTYTTAGQETTMNYYFTENEEKVCYEVLGPGGEVTQEACMNE